MLEKWETRVESTPARDAACSRRVLLAELGQERAVPGVHLVRAQSKSQPVGSPHRSDPPLGGWERVAFCFVLC